MPTIETQTNFWLDVELPEKLASLEYDVERGEFRQTEPAGGGPLTPDDLCNPSELNWDFLLADQCDDSWEEAKTEYQTAKDAETFMTTEEANDAYGDDYIFGNSYVYGEGPWN